jgi:hypothetical protein
VSTQVTVGGPDVDADRSADADVTGDASVVSRVARRDPRWPPAARRDEVVLATDEQAEAGRRDRIRRPSPLAAGRVSHYTVGSKYAANSTPNSSVNAVTASPASTS